MKSNSQTTWDLSYLFSDYKDPRILETANNALNIYKAFSVKWKVRTDYLTDPQVLRQALDEYELLERDYSGTGASGYYVTLLHYLDQSNTEIKSLEAKIHDIEIEISNSMEFFTNRISKIPSSEQEVLLSSPLLSKYSKFLQDLFVSGRHTLSEDEEMIVTLYAKPAFGNWVRMVKEFISKESKITLSEDGKRKKATFPELINLLSSKDSSVRDVSAKNVNFILSKYSDIAEREINSILQVKKDSDNLRGFTRPDESRHLGDDIESSVVDALISAVSESFDISSDFYKLKAEVMGVDKLKYHERNVTLGSLDKSYTYDETCDLIRKSLNYYSPSYGEVFDQAVGGGCIDVYPRVGKSGGGFCISNRVVDKSYILLNYSGKLSDVTTLAHEMGHYTHYEFSRKAQPPIYFGTSLATTEVASTFFESLVSDRLSKDMSLSEKFFYLMENLNDDVSTIFRQVACYKFELSLHNLYREKGYLSKKDIGELFKEHMGSYMGDYVSKDPGCENWWVYWSHVRSFFYVYSYASGFLIAKHMFNKVKDGNYSKDYISKLDLFLSSGTSKSPVELFSDMGIDITKKEFWLLGLNEIRETLNEARSLRGK